MTVHIHLGAHKTASTHIQAILKKNATALTAAGVTVARPKDVRAAVGAVRERLAHPLFGPLSGLSQRRAVRRLAHLGAGAPHLVAADENTLGLCPDVISSGVLYPHAGARSALWRGLVEGRDATVYLAVRAYPSFFASVHAQAGRNARHEPLSAEQAAALTALPRRWPAVINDVANALPNSKLILWAYEDYGALRPHILERMTGLTDLQPVALRPMRTPTAAAMKALSEAGQFGPVSETTRADIIEKHPNIKGAAAYSPWTPEQRAHMRAAYAEDLAFLKGCYGPQFLSVVPTAT
jgi:hypothetical protein